MITSADCSIWAWNTFWNFKTFESIIIMADIKTEIFNVKNVDCPSCAAKIENGLNAVDGVNEAVFDFASLTLHVKATDLERIIDEVHKIEPEVELVAKSEKTTSQDHDEASGRFKLKKELMILAGAAVLALLPGRKRRFSRPWSGTWKT